jgi:uncharacterized protein (TIGR02118 family)
VSAAYLIIYEGRPEDPEAFLNYYVEKHVPLVWSFPRIRRIEIERGVDDGDFFLITRLSFDSIEDLRAAITSSERERAREDMKNFPPFGGTVRRQAVEVLEMVRER